MSEHSHSFEYVSADTTGSTPSLAPSHGIADSRRRYALQYLGTFTYPVELRTLAVNVVAEKRNVPVETVSDDERERTAIRLHHIDMPKLVAEGLVAYDPESRMVVCTDTMNTERYVDSSDRSRQPDTA